MLSTSTNFDTLHNATNKKPLHVIQFDGVSTIICDHKPTDATASYKQWLISEKLSGLNQNIVPEKGKSSIGDLKFSVQDNGQAITVLMAADSTYFHRKKVVLKTGYVGNVIADLLQEHVGWITGISRGNDGASWDFVSTDPQKWLQKTIFRSATEAAPIYLSGNPINILLSILMSTDAGTNGNYDLGNADYGCGLTSESVNVEIIEKVRNQRFWGQTHNLFFEITEKIKAKDFIEVELLQLLNCYPQIDGNGKYFIIPFAPPVATQISQAFSEIENVLGDKIPTFDMNLVSMINEIDLQYDYDVTESDYLTTVYFVDGNSYNNRGPSANPLSIKSKGLKTNISPWSVPNHVEEIKQRRKDSIFARWSVPPIKIGFEAFFKQRLTEAGDILPFTHSKLPDVEAGTLGITAKYLEVISRSVDRKTGKVKITLLDTGFTKGKYSEFSPYMTVVSASGSTQFTVSVSDAEKFSEGWETKIVDKYMKIIASNITILTINTSTGVCTCDDIGQTPVAGWHVIFEDYDNATDDQKNYAYMADTDGYLGAGDDPAHLLSV